MTSTVIYGGQGNIQLKHLFQMIKTEKGSQILSKLKECDLESYQLMQNVLEKKVGLDDIHAAMLANFLYSEWATNTEEIDSGTIFSAHSAGIFNVLLSSQSAQFQDIVRFIRKRAQLIGELASSEELWLLMTEDLESFYQEILARQPEQFKLAIITDSTSGVLAMDEQNLPLLEELASTQDLVFKVKKLGVKAPYHTGFLDKSLEKYKELVEELNIQQNDTHHYIFHQEDLADELLYQWNNVFNWKAMKEEILAKSENILDLSPNKFISKQLLRMKQREKRNA